MTTILEADDNDFEALIAGRACQGYDIADGGIESVETLSMLKAFAASVRADFAPAAWLIAKDSKIVGMCSFIASPDSDGALPIGYGIAPCFRGQGIATEAIGAIIDWARRHPDLRRITAETAVSNRPSQRVLEHNGFVRTGERVDVEDGLLMCWARDVDRKC